MRPGPRIGFISWEFTFEVPDIPEGSSIYTAQIGDAIDEVFKKSDANSLDLRAVRE